MLVIKLDDRMGEDVKNCLRDRICGSLVGTPGFINNEIVVTDDCEMYIGNENDSDIQIEIRELEITKL